MTSSSTKKASLGIKNIQDWLSLGYIYLLALGISKDAIYYSFFDINILNYASLLDVVLSPINLLIERKAILILIILIIVVISLFPYIHKKNREKAWYKKLFSVEKLDKKYAETSLWTLLALPIALMLFSAYIGYGVGSGEKMSSKVYSGNFEPNYKITFSNNNRLNIKMIGQNSQYLFYAEEGTKKVTISPIQSNIKKIETINKKIDATD